MNHITAPWPFTLIVGIALCAVVLYALIARWIRDKHRRDEASDPEKAEFLRHTEEQLRQIHVTGVGDDEPELPIGL